MTAFPTYSTGTVSAPGGTTVVTGVGTSWSGNNVRPGDTLSINGCEVTIIDVTDATHLVIPPWPFGTVGPGIAYKVFQNSPLRFVGGQAMADVSTLVASLNSMGPIYNVAPTESVPNPSYGLDGQYAHKMTTDQWWIKSSGVWVISSSPSGAASLTANNYYSGVQTFIGGNYIAYGGSGAGFWFSSPTTNQWFLGTDSGGYLRVYNPTVGADVFSFHPTTGNAYFLRDTVFQQKITVLGNSAEIRAQGPYNLVSVGVQAYDYVSVPSYTEVSLRHYGTSAGGILAGIAYAGMGQLVFQNCTSSVIQSNGGSINFVLGGSVAPSLYVNMQGIGATNGSTGTLVVNGGIATPYGLWVAGVTNCYDIICARGPDLGAIFLGSSQLTYMYNNGTVIAFQGKPVLIQSGTASISHTTGALTINGGLGVGGQIFAGSNINTLGNYCSNGYPIAGISGPFNALYDQAGNAAILIGSLVTVGTAITYYRNATHYLQDVAGALNFASVNSTNFSIYLTTAATSKTTGALVVSGGAGFTNNVWAEKFLAKTGCFTEGGTTEWQGAQLVIESTTAFTWVAAYKCHSYCGLYLATHNVSIIWAYYCQGTTANPIGSITSTSTSTGYNTTSDGRRKPLRENFSGLELINSLRPVHHNWLNAPDQWGYGLIAQEAFDVLPQMIVRGDDDMNKRPGDAGFEHWQADYSVAVPVLIKAVQELSAENEVLKSRVAVLENA